VSGSDQSRSARGGLLSAHLDDLLPYLTPECLHVLGVLRGEMELSVRRHYAGGLTPYADGVQDSDAAWRDRVAEIIEYAKAMECKTP